MKPTMNCRSLKLNFLSNYPGERILKEKQDEVVIERIRAMFLSDYPIESIKMLSLNDYIFAPKGYGNPYSFCRRMRYETKWIASMGNAWPDVFGIYLKGGTEIKLSKTFSELYGSDYSEAFKSIKNEIFDLLKAAERDEHETIAASILNSIFKYKLLLIYYPQKYIPVCTKATMRGYFEAVGLEYDPEQPMIYQNLELVHFKEKSPEFREWSNWLFMTFLDHTWRMNNNLTLYELSE